MLGIVAVGVVREGDPNIFRAPMYRAHCAVIFATAQLSCLISYHYRALNRTGTMAIVQI